MKKNLILAILISAICLGCSRKSETGTSDTGMSDSIGKAHMASHLKLPHAFLVPTTRIMPANAANKTNLTLVMRSPNSASVSCYFAQGGSINQWVTISFTTVAGTSVDTITATQLGAWQRCDTLIPSNATGVVVTAGGVGGSITYDHSESYPIPAGGINTYGASVSKYWDDGPDTAYIVVLDSAVTNP